MKYYETDLQPENLSTWFHRFSNTTEVYNFSPQVYKTSAKLALDFDQIRITEADFVEAMCRLVPSTHRIQDQSQSPLVPRLRPLLASVVGEIC